MKSITSLLAPALALLTASLTGCGDGDTGTVVTGEYPVVYVERALAIDDSGALVPDDVRDPAEFRPGARLLLKRRAAPAAPVIDITTGLFQPGERHDVRDVTVSPDGARLLFALRGPYIDNANDEDQPTWNLWEYDIAAAQARRIITADIVAEEGHDIMPAYLPDGRIVFASTRLRASRAVLVDQGKPQFATLDDTRQREVFALHVMDADGTDIRQITFNTSHDLWPTVLPDGHVLFARQVSSGGRIALHLYRVRPDGRDLVPAFGAHSHDLVDNVPVEFTQPRLMDDGRVLVIERPYQTLFGGGALAAIDVASFTDANQRLDATTGEGGIAAFDLAGYPGETRAPAGGRYAGATPLGDNSGRLLVSWSACRLQSVADATTIAPCTGNDPADPRWREAAPIYGVFVYDPANGTRLPVVVPVEGRQFTDLAVAMPRATPAVLPDGLVGTELDADWYEAGVGVLDIRSVYDLDGTFDPLGTLFTSLDELFDPASSTAAQRPARWLRLETPAGIPGRTVYDFDQDAFGVTTAFGMREILGYIPIEPDGSVRAQVPANLPFTFSIVDAQGQRIGVRHEAWLQLMPGETRVCAGCHDRESTLPHGRGDSGVPVLHAGATGDAPYANTQPALVAQAGETMAQLRTRLDPDALLPDFDALFTDVWTDPLVRAPDADEALRYVDLVTAMPASETCRTTWTGTCRAIVHYETHIHSLWSVPRPGLAADGVTPEEHRCNTCHNTRDAMDMPRIADAQLDLGDGYSGDVALHMKAYRELLANDVEQVLDGGALVDRLVQQTDALGNPVFTTDADGNPVPVMVTVPVARSVVPGSARASADFFTMFAAGGDHAGWLSPAELRLLAEWIDLGAQYWNDPFLAPEN